MSLSPCPQESSASCASALSWANALARSVSSLGSEDDSVSYSAIISQMPGFFSPLHSRRRARAWGYAWRSIFWQGSVSVPMLFHSVPSVVTLTEGVTPCRREYIVRFLTLYCLLKEYTTGLVASAGRPVEAFRSVSSLMLLPLPSLHSGRELLAACWRFTSTSYRRNHLLVLALTSIRRT